MQQTRGRRAQGSGLVGGIASRAAAQVACGKTHSVALTAEGDVYTWGAGDEGQLGTGRTAPSFVPRYLTALQGTPIAMIATGAGHCAALSVYGLEDGAVRQSSTITLLDPNVKDVDATWEGRAFKFRLVRVDLPNQILVGGSMPVGLARPRLASIKL